MTNPYISICCLTYNHSQFISDALDGFLMQNVESSIEVLINDDASTDGTVEILMRYERNWPDIFKVIYQSENQYSKGNNKPAWNNILRARGKYVALCEGDDFWTTPHKLAKQIQFLDENHSYSMICHAVAVLDTSDNSLFHNYYPFPEEPIDIVLETLFSHYCIYTASVMLRRDLLPERVVAGLSRHSKDITLWSLLLSRGPGRFIPEYMAVYRHHSGGIWSKKKRLLQLSSQANALIEVDRIFKYGVVSIHEATVQQIKLYLMATCEEFGPLDYRSILLLLRLALNYKPREYGGLHRYIVNRASAASWLMNSFSDGSKWSSFLCLMRAVAYDPSIILCRMYLGAFKLLFIRVLGSAVKR